MAAGTRQSSPKEHLPLRSQEYKRTTDSQATGHLLTTNQSVSFFFPMPFSPTTYFTTRPTSPSTGFSFLLLVSLILRQCSFFQAFPPPRFPFSFHRCCMDLLDIGKRGGNSRWNSCHVDSSLGKGGCWRTVGERWSLGGLA